MIAAIARRTQAASRGDKGLSLVELLVVMMVSSIILALVGAFFVSISRNTISANQRRDSTAQASNAMNAMTTLVRAGTMLDTNGVTPIPAMIAGSSETLTMYTFSSTNAVAPAAMRIKISLDSSRRVVIQRWAAVDGTGTSTSQTYLGTQVAAKTGQDPLFVFLDGNNVAMTIAGSGLTSEQLAAVASVRITVRIQSTTSLDVEPIVIQNNVGMPNLGVQATED